MGKSRREKNKKLKKDRQISREKRNSIRKSIIDNIELLKQDNCFHFIFICSETKNMEQILVKLTPIENNNYIINLPFATIEDNCNDRKKFILDNFGIESDNIYIIPHTRVIVVKDFIVKSNPQDLSYVNVRPYNEYTWFNDDCPTTLNGIRIWSGRNLTNYFTISNEHDNVYLYQDILLEMLLYRMDTKKINTNSFKNTYFGEFAYEFGFEYGVRKKASGSGKYDYTFNKLCEMNDSKIKEIFKNELNEIIELNEKSKVLKLNSKSLL